MTSLFERQLSTYESYHRDHRNRLTHFVGIPAIVFSLILVLALWRFRIAGLSLSGAWLIGLPALAGWIALDRAVGLAMAVVVIPAILVAEWIVGHAGAATVWWLFGVLFVGGWVFQLVGHAFEGRRPALADNLFQAFIGPMFLVAEVLTGLGLRREPARAAEGDGAV
jgi:uncharacterized membrane protein YGL010W